MKSNKTLWEVTISFILGIFSINSLAGGRGRAYSGVRAEEEQALWITQLCQTTAQAWPWQWGKQNCFTPLPEIWEFMSSLHLISPMYAVDSSTMLDLHAYSCKRTLVTFWASCLGFAFCLTWQIGLLSAEERSPSYCQLDLRGIAAIASCRGFEFLHCTSRGHLHSGSSEVADWRKLQCELLQSVKCVIILAQYSSGNCQDAEGYSWDGLCSWPAWGP